MSRFFKVFSSYLFLISLNLVYAQNVDSQNISLELKRAIDDKVVSIMKKEKIIGLSYALVGKNGTIHQSAFGYSDRKNKKKTSVETVFANGSLSKLITVTAIIQLHEKGLIDIEEDIRHYITSFSMQSSFPKGLSDYSIKNILIHQSGLPSDYQSGLFNPERKHFSSLLELLKDENQPLPSGTISTYSNVSFSLLGVLIEEVSGLSYEEYIQQNIFNPLQMENAAFDLLREEIKQNFSYGYKKKKQLTPYTPYMLRETPAGNLISNVNDMSKFIQLYLNNGTYEGKQILSEESIKKIWQHQNTEGLLDFDYKLGLTWRLGNEGQSDMISSVPIRLHTGSTVLFCNILMIAPEQEVGVVVMVNTARKNTVTNNIGNEILKTYLSNELKIEEKEGYLLKKEKILSNKLIDNLPGNYATNFGMINISKKRKRLKADILNKNFKVKSFENNTFGIQLQLLGFIPIPIKNIDNLRLGIEEVKEKKVLVSHNLRGEKFFFGVAFEKNNNNNSWENKLGKYKMQNPDGDIQIIHDMEIKVSKSGIYYLQFIPKLYEKLPLRMPLHILDNKKAFIEGYSRWQGEYVRFLDENSFRYNGYFFKKIN